MLKGKTRIEESLYFQQRKLSLWLLICIYHYSTIWLRYANIYGNWVGVVKTEREHYSHLTLACFLFWILVCLFLMFLNNKLGICWPSHDLKWLLHLVLEELGLFFKILACWEIWTQLSRLPSLWSQVHKPPNQPLGNKNTRLISKEIKCPFNKYPNYFSFFPLQNYYLLYFLI